MPNKYTLHYFVLNGRGDCCRALLAHSNVEYEDKRFTFEQWPALKPTMPAGVVPCLEMPDGTKLGQTTAVLRMLGKMHGYYPGDPVLAAQADALIDTYSEFFGKFTAPFSLKGDEQQQAMKEILETHLPKLMALLEPNLDGTWLVGDKISTADFHIGGIYTNYMNNPALGYCKDEWAATKKSYPKFCAYGERYAAENANYLASRSQVPL